MKTPASPAAAPFPADPRPGCISLRVLAAAAGSARSRSGAPETQEMISRLVRLLDDADEGVRQNVRTALLRLAA